MLSELCRSDHVEIIHTFTLQHPGTTSDRCDLTDFCEDLGIPVNYAEDINAPRIIDHLRTLTPDIIFCLGWPRLLRGPVLGITKKGTIGYHPSLLPAHRGRHPLIWALALGLEETGSSFFLMDEGVDSGDLLSQEIIPISPNDTATSLYAKMIEAAKLQIHDVVDTLRTHDPSGTPQDPSLATYWRRRTPADGRIDWRMTAQDILNLVRALSPPYPPATFKYHGNDISVYQVQVLSDQRVDVEPGLVLSRASAGPVIKCGRDAIRLELFAPTIEVQAGEYL